MTPESGNCRLACLPKDGGRRPTFTGSGAACEWAASEVSRSGCPLDDEMSAHVAKRTWSQRRARAESREGIWRRRSELNR